MAIISIPLINQQVNSREDLNIYLSKIKALIAVILSSDLTELPEVVIHEYLWALSDFVERALDINQASLDLLLKFLRKNSDSVKES